MRRWRAAAATVIALCAVLIHASAADAETAAQQVVDRAVVAAADAGIEQSVSVVDRTTGDRVAGSGGARQYISEVDRQAVHRGLLRTPGRRTD